jgi:hypothetical protein
MPRRRKGEGRARERCPRRKDNASYTKHRCSDPPTEVSMAWKLWKQ